MGFFNQVLCDIFTASTYKRLMDLGVDPSALGANLNLTLRNLIRRRRKELTANEAAAYFFGSEFSNLPRSCYNLPVTPYDLSKRSEAVMVQWVRCGRMNERLFPILQDMLFAHLKAMG